MKKNRKMLMACFFLLAFTAVCSSAVLLGSNNKNKELVERKKIGILYMTMNNPYFNVINKEIIAVAEERGDQVITRDSGLDAERQIRQIESFVKNKVDIILLNVVDWKAVEPALEKAQKAGIPVLAVDAQVYNADLVVGTITSDNYGAGEIIAEDLMTKSKGGKILLLEHKANKSSQDRIQGFLDTLDKNHWPYTIIEDLETYGQLEIAEPLVEEIINRGEEINVVVGLNDPAALGAMAALDSKGKLKDVLVYGVDGAPEAKAMIYKNLMTGTVAQSPTETGKVAAKYMYEILKGKEIPMMTTIPVQLISGENISDYSLTSWE